MARIGFLVLYATGHLNPSIALARGLAQRGHEVVFFNVPDVGAAIESAGLGFVPFAEQEYPPGTLRETTRKIGELTGAASFAYFIERMSLLTRVSFQYLPALLAANRPDLLIIDQLFPGASTVADHLGIPFVSIANALIVNSDHSVPPPTLPWPYDPADAAVARNAQGWAGTLKAFDPLLALVNAQREKWSLPPCSNFLNDSFSTRAQISQQPAFFEFPRASQPATLHFVGPLQDDMPAREIPFPWEKLDGRPLIYASLGTLQNRLESVFRAIIEACAPLPAQTVIALGKDALAPELFGEVAENILLVPFAPQSRLLARASLCITHAGLNTALDCLVHGVPMVAMPIASEQPGVAMRVAYLGAGVVLPLAEVNAESLGTAISKVWTDPAYREAADNAAQQLKALHPVDHAVRIVEATLAEVAARSTPA
ncbi:nucleotide disphospho-sugar-binding domain-containing protein [Acidipila sp. EB88]|uniref:nucleotide disphospho-sugar-binding domain-containing protein n=1 Tax=Acidipila sp. EB88 TaxID=2305226 RepID=UPI000F5D8FF2|nr:nucleotide disphospho-sugar-binding domain-containing protein [Acidipila sp. EB88]RRA47354.1 glycosyl transferase [Acidipila sp. EB88]